MLVQGLYFIWLLVAAVVVLDVMAIYMFFRDGPGE